MIGTIISVLSVLIGAGVTWLVSRHYYKRAGDELKNEADKLRHVNEMILRWLEVDGNNIKVIRDESGKPVSLARTTESSDSLSVSCSIVGIRLERVDDEPRT